ncbi:MAG: hypothetical protein K8S22_09445 [Betaproteobacteria bacterium]|nr:hypothetical protein [Betaproteobacteria bacterium]
MLKPGFLRTVIANVLVWLSASGAANAASSVAAGKAEPAVRPALAAGSLGLFPAADFRLVPGTCADCPTPKEALWYFRDDLIAVPGPGAKVAGFTDGVAAKEDVRRWYAAAGPEELQARPPLIWVGSPSVITDARLQESGNALRLADGTVTRFAVTPKIPANLSYYDASTAKFFTQRPLRIRGTVAQGVDGKPAVTARTIWPQDYVIDAAASKLSPLAAGETLSGLVRQADSAPRYETRLLWERTPGQPRNWDQLAALGVMLNGSQGDDDEAHGGHFAIVTGRGNARGEWSDWLVNNFYNLDSFSEKGIVASMVPMDNYLMDLNSGQAYYRPSYMLVALMRSDRAVFAYQGAIARVYNHFYRHDFRYRHAGANCAGISIDTLRSLGWNIPARGATSYAKAAAAYPYMALKEMSFDSGKSSFDYLSEEQTRLYPAVAFDAIGNDLLQLVGAQPAGRSAASAYEELLKSEVEAIIFVRIPQIPSSRAVGSFPVASIDEYMQRTPADRAQWKIVPVGPRPFPSEFVSAATEPATQNNGALPVTAGLLLAGILGVRAVRRRRARKA